MSKRFLIIFAALIVLFTGALVLSKKDTSTSPGNSSAKLSEHKVGQNTKNVTLVEYGDFQCSACYQFESVLEQIREIYKNDITFQFRHFPLSEIHLNAVAAARASEAASNQGKFWEMHDALYKSQDPSGKSGWVASKTPNTFFEEIARQLNLDVEKFKTDSASAAVNDVIQADRAEAKRLGFNGTPSFMLDGKQISQPRADLEFFKKLIDEAIASKNPAPAPTATPTQQ